MSTPNIELPAAPAWVRVFLLLLLPAIAGVIYWDGQHYASDLLIFEPVNSSNTALFPAEVQGLARFGQVRSYDKNNLYEYINGHAEFFLSAGFQALNVGEYAPPGATAPTLVVNLYDMGKALHAFGVLIDESSGEAVEVGAMGFASDQGVNFIVGPYYVQLSVFDAGLTVLPAAQSVAAFLGQQAKQSGLAFDFPQLGQPGATRFVKEFYRGMEFLNNILERSFHYGEADIAAFLTTDGDPAATQAAVLAFLAADGIPVTLIEAEGITFYQVDDPYEGQWFFVPLPERLLGVYAPLDDTLRQRIIEFTRTTEAKT